MHEPEKGLDSTNISKRAARYLNEEFPLHIAMVIEGQCLEQLMPLKARQFYKSFWKMLLQLHHVMYA